MTAAADHYIALYRGDVVPDRCLTVEQLAAHTWRDGDQVWLEDHLERPLGRVGFDAKGWWYSRNNAVTRWYVGTVEEAVERIARPKAVVR